MEPPLHQIAAHAQESRVLQYKNRRYSLRLEPIFWRWLQSAAEKRGLRLSRLVAELAEDFGGANLASHLRSFSMLEAERQIAARNIGDSSHGLVRTISECPTPGLVISEARVILHHNTAVLGWLGEPAPALVGRVLDDVFQVRTRRRLADIWSELVAGENAGVQIHLVYVVPGRVSAAQAKLVPVHPVNGGKFYCVAWLLTGKKTEPVVEPRDAAQPQIQGKIQGPRPERSVTPPRGRGSR